MENAEGEGIAHLENTLENGITLNSNGGYVLSPVRNTLGNTTLSPTNQPPRGINPLNIGASRHGSTSSLASNGGPLSPGGESNISLPSLSNFPQEQRKELRRMYLAGFKDAAKKSKAKKSLAGGAARGGQGTAGAVPQQPDLSGGNTLTGRVSSREEL